MAKMLPPQTIVVGLAPAAQPVLGTNPARKRYLVQNLGPGNAFVSSRQENSAVGVVANAPPAGSLAGASWVDEDTSGKNVHCGPVWVVADQANTKVVVTEWV